MTQTINKRTLCFHAIDTLFFRESRPMDATGELQSVFPPSTRTVIGAIRAWIGTQEEADWYKFRHEANYPLRKLIGDPKNEQDLGRLQFRGVWLSYNGQRLYPAPLNLMCKKRAQHNQKSNQEAAYDLFQLALSTQGYYCDLGKNVRLAELPCEAAQGSKPLRNMWINKAAFVQLLRGQMPIYNQQNFFTEEQLFARESRIGIARNAVRGTVETGMLYQTQHIRPKAKTAIEMDVMGLKEAYPQNSMIRLGGEGRSVNMHIRPPQQVLSNISPSKKMLRQCQGIILYVLTPLLIDPASHNRGHVLPHFNKQESAHAKTYWLGSIKGIELKIYGAIVGKALREGGWDLSNHRPRPVRSLLPAGSLFYCEVSNGDIRTAINTLADIQLGQLQQYGYGQIAVGLWK